MNRNHTAPLLGVLVLAVVSLGATILAGNTPQLGLDLQGGASVVLQPDRSKGKVDSAVLDQSIEIIRNRVDALGVAEPDISRQGDSIIVQLPGVKNQNRALEIVGQTAELRFRPVLADVPVSEEESTRPPSTTTPTATSEVTPTVGGIPTSTRAQDLPEREVVLPEIEKGEVTARYRLGPAELTGRAVRTARAAITDGGQWEVDVRFNRTGSAGFDAMAARYVNNRIAIVLDGVVKSAPVIQTAEFNGRASITGSFSQSEARDLALVLRYGSLPIQLEPETVQRVSATLGKDSLSAGVKAGLLGLLLVALYMLVYYRALGLVVILGLAVSGALMYSLIAYLGATSGLALSLSGVVGIVISVGVTVDSYIVYFERLKDEIRSGKSIRSSVDRGFSRAYRTIIAADFSSLIGAGVLYWLTVGSVRGFAFFLGLSALLDLGVAWFFTRPIVAILGRNRFFTEAPVFGVARGLAAEVRSS